MLVSELEKNAEIRMRIASAANSRPSEVSFKSALRLYRYGIEMVEKNGLAHKSAFCLCLACLISTRCG